MNSARQFARALVLVLQRTWTALETAMQRSRLVFVTREYQPAPRYIFDYWIAMGIGLAGMAIAAWASTKFDPRVNEYWNIYFHADPNRVFNDLQLEPLDIGFRRQGGVHPIFSILMYVPMQALAFVGFSQLMGFTILLVASAGFSTGLFYLAMRGLHLSRGAAVLFCGAFMASATFVHWVSFVETYAFALLTGVIMLVVMTSSRYRPCYWILASAGTLSVTLTNWGLGLAAAFFHLSVRRFIFVSITAFFVVTGFAIIQKVVMPSSALFFFPRVWFGETKFVAEKRDWSPIENLRAMVLTSAVAPVPAMEDDPTDYGVFRLVSNQHSSAIGSAVGGGAVICWAFLLASGVWGAWRTASHRAVAMSVGSFVLFQLALHTVYGDITFLYAANFFPALLVLVALG